MTLHPTAVPNPDPELVERFTEEPNTVLLRISGQEIFVPKDNGIVWWFPRSRPNAPALEMFFSSFFSIVNAMQTIRLFIWPCQLIYQVGLLKTALSIPLTIPIGSSLQDTHGENSGSFYTSLNAIFLTHQVFHLFHLEAALSFVALLKFLGLVAGIGHGICLGEYVIERTWWAAILAYAQLGVWIYELSGGGSIDGGDESLEWQM
jgi:hypothetical protein